MITAPPIVPGIHARNSKLPTLFSAAKLEILRSSAAAPTSIIQSFTRLILAKPLPNLNNLEEREIKRDDIKFFYRGSDLPQDFIISSVKLKGQIMPREIIEKKQLELIERKKLSQPSKIKTCGSTFKNINDEKKAWKLIKESGCDQFQVGDASISKTHCNFFVNNGKAKSIDIENLINKVKKAVNNKTGINLELEIKIIGE